MVAYRRAAIFRDPATPPVVDTRSGETYTFDELGRVPYTLAATLVCLRRRAEPVCDAIYESELATDAAGGKGALVRYMIGGQIAFRSGWQVLVGQSTVVNYLKTTKDKVSLMRYPGEYMFPGGAQDEDDPTLYHTARRELAEEFLIRSPAEAAIFPFNARQTRKIRGTSNMMVNFLAIAETQSSDWLSMLDLDIVNAELDRRCQNVEELIRHGTWDTMSLEEKLRLSPEVRQLRWMNIEDLVRIMQQSISKELRPVNSWQRDQFAVHGISKRSPMSVSMATLVDVEGVGADKLLHASRISDTAECARTRDRAALDEKIDEESYRFSVDVHMLGQTDRQRMAKL